MKSINKNMGLRTLTIALLVLISQLVAGSITPVYAATIPSYSVQFIGGTPKAMNNFGHAVGWISINGSQRAWVFTGSGRELLPVPEGWHSQANDINDGGVVVGSAGGGASVPDRAVQWQPNGSGYIMSSINTPETDNGATAIAINNFGDIVGTRTFLTEFRTGNFTYVTRGFLFENNGILRENLSDLGFNALPKDINDEGQIVGGSVRMTGSLVEDLGVPTVPEGSTRYTITYLNSINNLGQVAASTVLATSMDANRTASRFTDGTGWEVLSFIGSYDAAYGINDSGDVTFEASYLCPNGGAASPVVYLEGIGRHCIEDLLADSDWTLIGAMFDNDINNNSQIIVTGSNSITGESGAVLLTPAGPLAPPAAPQNLVAVTHEADSQQPWNAIQLSWIDASINETGFRIERRLSGTSTWNVIKAVGIGTQSYNDINIDSETTYEYQIIATGLAGDSLPSNVVSATAPNTEVDTESPSVFFLSPIEGDEVSGNVQVTLNVTDNIAVTSVNVETVINSSQVPICDVYNPATDTVSCSWNTRKLSPGIYQLNTTVSDALGNYSQATINVELIAKTKGGGGKCNPKKGC